MEKVDLTKQFAHRLREAMIAAGLNSQRSASGVSIPKLAEMTGYSLQICRRYLRGEALPEPQKLVELAGKLQVSPGWLLFGESGYDIPIVKNNVLISKNLLHYLFSCAGDLYLSGCAKEEISDFLLGLTQDLCQINTSEEQSKKIVDLALSSVKHFNS